nr:MAG TPA: hypothetical protein [Caudoviricetes sp.]
MTIHKRGFVEYIVKTHIYSSKYRCELFLFM